MYKGKIFQHAFSIFTPLIVSFGIIGFRGCNPEVHTLLLTPILIAWSNYGVYGNYGHKSPLWPYKGFGHIVAIDDIVDPGY